MSVTSSVSEAGCMGDEVALAGEAESSCSTTPPATRGTSPVNERPPRLSCRAKGRGGPLGGVRQGSRVYQTVWIHTHIMDTHADLCFR